MSLGSKVNAKFTPHSRRAARKIWKDRGAPRRNIKGKKKKKIRNDNAENSCRSLGITSSRGGSVVQSQLMELLFSAKGRGHISQVNGASQEGREE